MEAGINTTPAMRGKWRIVAYYFHRGVDYQIVAYDRKEYYLRTTKDRKIVSKPYPSFGALARVWMAIANGERT